MKTQMKLFTVMFGSLLTMAYTLFAKPMHYETARFNVHGNCTMCKKRIESALLKNSHIKSAEWNVDTKILTVTYDPHTIGLDAIHKIIAEAGHDTDNLKATDDAYNNLPGCCHYDRKK